MRLNSAKLLKVYWKSPINPMTEQIELIKQQAIKDYSKKNFNSALQGFQACLNYFETQHDELAVAEAHNNLSVTYLGMKFPQLAYDEVVGTDQVFIRYGDKKRQAMAIANTAAALEALGKKEDALALYDQTLDIFKELGEKEMRTSILRRISDLQLKTRRGYQAIASIEAALDQKEAPQIKDSIFKRIFSAIRHRLIN